MAGNLFIARGTRGDPAQNCRDVLQAMSAEVERRRSRRAPSGPKGLSLHPIGHHWHLKVTIGGQDAYTGELYRVTTASPLLDVHLAAAARAVRVVHTRTTKPCWRRVGDSWTADIE
ncbi:hypothetical protein Vau01_099350 [Virgisporangium aurantiacum]|uniref:Uncharacterized protein n=1 Tax=Virgisporangium aurantiacum TaxID=175570 RepID=A0A8J3ZDY7_9ACTN|nr:hypothetical protein Vau01_099350 [Virgisporangium aurantiacum]